MGVPKSGWQVEAWYCLHTMTSYHGLHNFPTFKALWTSNIYFLNVLRIKVYHGPLDFDMHFVVPP